MRAFFVVLFLAATAQATDPAVVDALIQRLGARDCAERRAAYTKLQSMGEEILPQLMAHAPRDLETRRRLHELTRAARRLKLLVKAPPGPHPLGSPLRLRIQLVNETDRTWLIPFQRIGRGVARSSFGVVFGDGDSPPISLDQIDPITEMEGRSPMLAPGRALEFELTLEGEAALNHPGTTEVTVYFRHSQVHFLRGAAPKSLRRFGSAPGMEHQRVEIEALPVRIFARARAARELEAALTNPQQRKSAIAELLVREDPAILPVLRRHVDDPDLRLAAIRGISAVGHADDLAIIRKAVRDIDSDVRRAAVIGLGQYPQRRARSKLVSLTHDVELKKYAVRALAKHRNAATINCFINLLPTEADPEIVKLLEDTLTDWTGLPVRRSEIGRFRSWWEKNYRRWISENK